MATVRQAHREHRLARLDERTVRRDVGARPAVGLQVRVLGPEQLLGPFDTDVLGMVDLGASAVVALARDSPRRTYWTASSPVPRDTAGDVKFSLAISCSPLRARSSSDMMMPAISGSSAINAPKSGPQKGGSAGSRRGSRKDTTASTVRVCDSAGTRPLESTPPRRSHR